MKSCRLPLIALIATVAIGLSVSAWSDPPEERALDFKAVFKTHLPHLHSQSGGGGRGVPGGNAQSALPTSFSGNPYAVGPIVAATTTPPEAEEYIAVDPNNSNNL